MLVIICGLKPDEANLSRLVAQVGVTVDFDIFLARSAGQKISCYCKTLPVHARAGFQEASLPRASHLSDCVHVCMAREDLQHVCMFEKIFMQVPITCCVLQFPIKAGDGRHRTWQIKQADPPRNPIRRDLLGEYCKDLYERDFEAL